MKPKVKNALRYAICFSFTALFVGQTVTMPVLAQEVRSVAAGGGACGHIAPALLADINALGIPNMPTIVLPAGIDIDMTWQSYNSVSAILSADLTRSLQEILSVIQTQNLTHRVSPNTNFKFDGRSKPEDFLEKYVLQYGQLTGQWVPGMGTQRRSQVQEFNRALSPLTGRGQMPITNDLGTRFGFKKLDIPDIGQHSNPVFEIFDSQSATYIQAQDPAYEAAFLAMSASTLQSYETRNQIYDPSMVVAHSRDMLAKMPPEFAPVAYAIHLDLPPYDVHACGGEPTTPTPIPVIIPKTAGGMAGIDCEGWREHLPICTDAFFFSGGGDSNQRIGIAVDFTPPPNRNNVMLRLNYGAEVSPEGFLTTLALKRRNGVTVCSGVLVDDRHVLSAAHCFCDGEKPLTAVFGTSAAKSNHDKFGDFRGEIHLSDKIIFKNSDYCPLYRKWEATGRIGIAPSDDLVLLRTDARLPTSVSYAMLPTEPLWSNQPHHSAKIVGYGANDNSDFSGTKHSASISIDPDGCSTGLLASECHAGKEFMATSEALKANSDSCFADSGAPVFIKQGKYQYLAGIVSRGTSKNQVGKCGKGGIYVDLRNKDIRNWLSKRTQPN